MSAISSIQALHRFGLGPRPGDEQRYGKDGRAALESDLKTTSSPDPSLTTTAQGLAIYRDYLTRTRAIAQRPAEEGAEGSEQAQAARRDVAKKFEDTYRQEMASTVSRMKTAEIGFVERLVAFWSNHFTISGNSNKALRLLGGPFEREAIRPHVLGRFEDMLLASCKHVAMLLYLDNVKSMSARALRGGEHRGLNENLAREIMELHTIGVDGGYDQEDVTALARILTGWTADRRGDGGFTFRADWHEAGTHTVMGKKYLPRGLRQGEDVLRDLARRPETGRYIARSIASAFVSDTPSDALIAALETSFNKSGGDLKQLALTLVRSDESWTAPPKKIKNPQEFLWSAIRGLDIVLPTEVAIRSMRHLGHLPWSATSPAGFPKESVAWLGPDALTNRLDVSEKLVSYATTDLDPNILARELLGSTLPQETAEAVRHAESRKQALTLLLMSPDFQQR